VGVKVVALSVDDEATTRDLIAKHKLSFPIGYGAGARAIAAATGAYLNEDLLYMQSTGFVLAPDGTVVNASIRRRRSDAWWPRTWSAWFHTSSPRRKRKACCRYENAGLEFVEGISKLRLWREWGN
jgi:hypothetical protein